MTSSQISHTPFFSVNIQAMRGIAALMIVLGHCLAFASVTLPNWLGSNLIHTFAYAGVDIFFVISGIVVTAAAQKNALVSTGFISFRGALHFIVKRLFRIYPIYWIVFLSVCLFSPLLHLKLENIASTEFFASFFLLLRNNPFIPQAWTLVYEGYFYLILALIVLFFSRHFYKAIALWMLLTFCVAAFFSFKGISQSVYSDPMIFEFGLGCFIQFLVHKEIKKRPRLFFAIGLLFFILGAIQTGQSGLLSPVPRVLSFGIGSAFILYSLISFETFASFKFPKFSAYLGDISYSIYLWHELVIGFLLYCSSSLGNFHKTYPLAFVSLTIFSVLVISGCSYHLIERPLMKLAYLFLRTPADSKNRHLYLAKKEI